MVLRPDAVSVIFDMELLTALNGLCETAILYPVHFLKVILLVPSGGLSVCGRGVETCRCVR